MFIWTEDGDAINSQYVKRLSVELQPEGAYQVVAYLVTGDTEYIGDLCDYSDRQEYLRELVTKINRSERCQK